MAALGRDMLALSVDLRELEARLDHVKSRLPGLQAAMDQIDELEEAENGAALPGDRRRRPGGPSRNAAQSRRTAGDGHHRTNAQRQTCPAPACSAAKADKQNESHGAGGAKR